MSLSNLINEKYRALVEHLAAEGFVCSPPYSEQLPDAVCRQLADYVELLAKWTERVDLVAPAAPEVLVERHVIDCLAAGLVLGTLPALENRSCLDVGSGAGLPGLIWAIVESGRPMLLCEPRQKRVVFLREAIRRLELAEVAIVEDRVENVSRGTFSDSGFGLATARALGSDQQFLEAVAPLLTADALAVLLVGPNWQSPAETPENLHFEGLIPYSLSSAGPRRQLAVWRSGTGAA